jgi:RNA polymerase sigma-70 factor (ECF subfamily)
MTMTAWLPAMRTGRRRLVSELREAAAARDLPRLRSLLAPEAAVVVDAGEPDRAMFRVVRGAEDAALLLTHALGSQPGLEVSERSVNDRPGLIVSRRGRATAAIAVDVSGAAVDVVWVRLHPTLLRHGNAV